MKTLETVIVIVRFQYQKEGDKEEATTYECGWKCASNSIRDVFKRLKSEVGAADGSKRKPSARLNRFAWFLVPLTGSHLPPGPLSFVRIADTRIRSSLISPASKTQDFNLCSTFHNIAFPEGQQSTLPEIRWNSWICNFNEILQGIHFAN